jgi:hypothetical protein
LISPDINVKEEFVGLTNVTPRVPGKSNASPVIKPPFTVGLVFVSTIVNCVPVALMSTDVVQSPGRSMSQAPITVALLADVNDKRESIPALKKRSIRVIWLLLLSPSRTNARMRNTCAAGVKT